MSDPEDEDDSTDDFLLLQWDIDSGTHDAKSSKEEDEQHIYFAEEISLLASSEVGDMRCEGDLDSVVKRIGSPFLYDCNPDHTSQNNIDSRSKNGRCIICNIIDLRQRENIIKHYMGTMAKCRGKDGDALREAGAISSLLYILWRLIVPKAGEKNNSINANDPSSSTIILLPNMSSNGEDDLKLAALTNICNNHQYLRRSNKSNYDEIIRNEFDMAALDLATACLGSLRDLACGSAANRAAILSWIPPSRCDITCIENGVHVVCAYIKRYDQWKWEEIITLKQRGESNKIGSVATVTDSTTYTERGKKELRLLTNTLGVVRNVTHSTPDICHEFFNHGLVDILVWRIIPDSSLANDASQSSTLTSSSLPDASCPWRESSFRAAASLINLAEKCPDVAYQLSSDRTLIYLLIETWGGAGAINIDLSNNKMNSKAARSLPVLHLGLAAILNAACDNGALEGGLDNVMAQVLEKEKIRKRAAQRREEERKLQQMKQKNR